MKLNHFDENVLYRIKSDAIQIRQTYEQYLLALLNDEFSAHEANVVFDENGFQLNDAITIDGTSFNIGRYDLAKTNTHEHVIRLNHPFVQALLDRFKAQILKPAKLVFDYDAYGLQVSSLKPLIGNSGCLIAELLEVSSLGRLEQHLVLSAITNSGEILADDDPEKLLKLPMKSQADIAHIVLPENICLEQENRKNRILEQVNVRNLGFFDQEIIKLDGWADDLKNSIVEKEVKRKQGKMTQYKLGSSILIDDEYILTAFSRFNKNNQAELTIQENVNFLLTFWNEINRLYAQRSVTVPVFGAGITRFKNGFEDIDINELLRIMIWTFKISKIKFAYPAKLTIIVHDDLLSQVNLYELKENE